MKYALLKTRLDRKVVREWGINLNEIDKNLTSCIVCKLVLKIFPTLAVPHPVWMYGHSTLFFLTGLDPPSGELLKQLWEESK